MYKGVKEELVKNNAHFFVQYSTSNDANFYYATNFKVGDPVLYAVNRDIDMVVVPEMEKNRAIREANVGKVFSLNDLNFSQNLKELEAPREAVAHTYLQFLQSQSAEKVLVPPDFPSFLSFYFKDNGMDVVIVDNPFSASRKIKTEEEIENIRKSSQAAVSGVEHLIKLLKLLKKGKTDSNKDGNGFRGCEWLRNEVEMYLYSQGYEAKNTIVSSGMDTAEPHNIGEGEVEKHVIFDVFPQSKKTNYFSDFTRTVVLKRQDEIEDMLDAVIEAKEAGISMVRDGVRANEVHDKVCDILEDRGYHALRGESREGFIHSTGHGVGLEVHEKPSIYTREEPLESGMVATIEPGLYYKDIGGVRVEDTVVVRKNDCEVLTKYPNRVDLNE
ncbi:MAG: Xaa-Pro peptidase family protein [Archaeoglobaceae archaeon]